MRRDATTSLYKKERTQLLSIRFKILPDQNKFPRRSGGGDGGAVVVDCVASPVCQAAIQSTTFQSDQPCHCSVYLLVRKV